MPRTTISRPSVYLALLRGINVGGHRVIKMADLREMFVAAGATSTSTYIQSGNVVFAHATRSVSELTAALERHIAATSGFEVPVVLRTAAELAAVIARNPFADAEPDHLHVSFLATAPPDGALSNVDAATFVPERFALVERDLYLSLPDGIGRSKLAGTLARHRSVAAATTRNWRTVGKLHEMVTAAVAADPTAK